MSQNNNEAQNNPITRPIRLNRVTNQSQGLPVTSEGVAPFPMSGKNKKKKKEPQFCAKLFFCQFNKFFKKDDFKEIEMNSLPDPACSENILKKFDKIYASYELKEAKKFRKVKRPEQRLAKAKTSNPGLDLNDSTTNLFDQQNTFHFGNSSSISQGQLNNFNFRDSNSSISVGSPSLGTKEIQEKRLKMDHMMSSIYYIVRFKILTSIVLNVISTVLKIAIPITMKNFLQNYKSNDPIHTLIPWMLTASLLSFLDGVIIEHSSMNVCGCKAMTGQILRSVFYRKITKATYSFLKVTDSSFINKMVLYEFEHIIQMVGEIPKLVTSPITLILVLVNISLQLKIMVFIVLGVFAISLLLLVLVKRKIVRKMRAYLAQESKKSEKLNECIPNMKQIKLNSLEQYFLKKLQKIRGKESKNVIRMHVYEAFSDSIFDSTPLFCSILVIGTMAILQGGLNASDAFSVIIVLDLLQNPLATISSILDKIQAYSSAKRAFRLFLEDVPEKTHLLSPNDPNFPNGQIIMENCNFDFVEEKQMTGLLDQMMGEEWVKDKAQKEEKKKLKKMKTMGVQRIKKMKTNSLIFSGSFRGSFIDDDNHSKLKKEKKQADSDKEKFVTLLRGINVVIKPGQKVCLVGNPGSGFSEFLLSLMSEAKLSNNGLMNVKGSVSYLNVRMQNFFNGTVKRNIILNADYNDERFTKVTSLLNINLRSLKGQEYFRIMEGAKNLTTDMQRKILLARWIYEEKDIYLIDDLFDDMNVMEWNMIYENLFLNELKDKTVIFMSYTNLQIKIADHIIVFDSGMIKEQGSYTDLLRDADGELRKIVGKDNNGGSNGGNLFSKLVEGTRLKKTRHKRSSILAQKGFSAFGIKNKAEVEEKPKRISNGLFASLKKNKKKKEEAEQPKRISNGLFASLKKKKKEEEPVKEEPKRISNGLFASLKKKKKPESPELKPKIVIDEESQSIFSKSEKQSKRDSNQSPVSARRRLGNRKKEGLFSNLQRPKKAIDSTTEEPKLLKIKPVDPNKSNSSHNLSPNRPNNIKLELENLNKPVADKLVKDTKRIPNLTGNRALDGLAMNMKFLEDMNKDDDFNTFGKTIEKDTLNYKQAKSYLKKYMLMRGKGPLIFIIVLFLISSLFSVSYYVWVGFWSIKLFGEKEDSPYFYFNVYLGLSITGTVYQIARDVIYDYIFYESSNLVNKMVLGIVMRLKMDWFVGQSMERIIYRLTKDQSQLDIFIPKIVLKLIDSSMMVFVGFIILNYIYYALVIIISLVYVCIIRKIFKRYLRVVMSMTHMVTQRKAEVVSLGGQTLNMCVYLRGTKNLGYLKSKFFVANDQFQKCTTHVGNFSQRWIGIRLTYIATSLIFMVFCFPVFASLKRDFFFQSIWKIAFSMTWGFKTIKYLKVFLRSMSLVFINIISISRLYEYVEAKKHIEVKYGSKNEEKKESENGKNTLQINNQEDEDNSPRASEPSNFTDLRKICLTPANGKFRRVDQEQDPATIIPMLKQMKLNRIKLTNVSLSKKFRGDLLHNISLEIDASETVGLYGRSLSGIPELIEVICGLFDRKRGKNYPNSDITISDQSIDKFNLNDWRTCFTYLREEPLIISGKVRDNIDPMRRFSDEDIIKALDILKFNELTKVEDEPEENPFTNSNTKKMGGFDLRMDSIQLENIVEEEDELSEVGNLSEFQRTPKKIKQCLRQNQTYHSNPQSKVTTKKSVENGRNVVRGDLGQLRAFKNNGKGGFNSNKNPDEIITQKENKPKWTGNKISDQLKLPFDISQGQEEIGNTEDMEIQEKVTPAFGQNFDFTGMNYRSNPNYETEKRLSKTLKNQIKLKKTQTQDESKSDFGTPKAARNIQSPKSTKTVSKNLGIGQRKVISKGALAEKRRYSGFPSISNIYPQLNINDEPENMNPRDMFEDEISQKSQQKKNKKSGFSIKIDEIKNEKKNSKMCVKKKLEEHKVPLDHQEDIKDFLDYQVLPKAMNLTIGLKKIIMLAKVFLEEPNFIILEENALDFDELDNSHFFNILKVK